MHVAYIHQHFTTPRGSSGTRSYEMSRRLLAAGHRVTMICGAYEHRDADVDLSRRVNEYQVDGIEVKCIAESYANWMGFGRRVLAFGRFAATATRVVSRLDADLVLATSTPLTVGVPGMKAARRLGVPFVFEVRDLWPEIPIAMGIIRNPLLIRYLRRLERRIYRAADWIIALAPGIKDGVCRAGFPAERVVLIPNCSDVDLFRPDDRPLQDERFGDSSDLRLVFTGAHGRANGLDAVLDAAAELKRRGQRGVRFVFIGEGSEKQRLMDRSRCEGLDHVVSWVPPMSKQSLARILPGMDVGMQILRNVRAFYYGTSPNKFFDYIACGLPVLNNYPGWLADLIGRHECGLAVPPDDPGAFADAVLELRDHPDLRRRMGRRARELAEMQFARDRLAEAFVRTLEQAAAAPRRAPR